MAGARALIDEVIEADWRHPGWWALAAWLRAGERLGAVAPEGLYEAFLMANGGPRADTFMARPVGLPVAAERIARAVRRAWAAVETLSELEGRFPGQRLAVSIARDGARVARRRLADARSVVFVLGARTAWARIEPGDDGHALVAALARFATGAAPARPLAAAHDGTAAIAIALDDAPLSTARHVHRRAWGPGGGPWLGVGEADGPEGRVELTTTCHLAIDGYAHAQVTRGIFARTDGAARAERDPFARIADEVLAERWLPSPAPDDPDHVPLGFASARIARNPRLADAAWATGFAVEELARAGWSSTARTSARLTPTFQVPIALGDPDDPDRRRRRVVFGLCAVPMEGGRLLDPAALRDRLRPWVTREAAARGLLSRLAAATLALPLPARARHRILVSDGRPRARVPMIEALAGRGTLALLRFPDGEHPAAPLVAASSPSLIATPTDPRGGVVVTLIEHAEGCTVSLAGTGHAGTAAGARGALAGWLDALERAQSRP